MAMKDLVPEAMRPAAKRLRRKLVARVEGIRTPAGPATSGPALTDVAIADEHVLTFLISSKVPVAQLSAEVEAAAGTTSSELQELLRYDQDGRSFVLAKLSQDSRLVPGTKIRVMSDQGEVSIASVKVRQTRDKSYPLIDRLVVRNGNGALLIEEGKQRKLRSPLLGNLTWTDEPSALVISTDLVLSAASLRARDEDGESVAIPTAGPGLVVTADLLARLCPTGHVGPVLMDIEVTTEGEQGGISHPDPWLRVPRNYQTFLPHTVVDSEHTLLVRPYWTLSGNLSLKVRNR